MNVSIRTSAVLWLLFLAAPLFAQNGRGPFPMLQIGRHVRGEEAVAALGSRLPEIASWYGKTRDQLQRLLRHDRHLWVSRTGRLMYICELETPLPEDPEIEEGPGLTQPGYYPLDQTFRLHSMPGSNRTIYLDFDGATVSGTVWNENYNGGSVINAAPYDIDGNPSSFSTTELQRIQNIWKRVAEDYAPFDVDVTTEQPPQEALTRTSSSDQRYGNTVVITPTNFYPNAGGVSYVGVFDNTGDYYKISWVFSNRLSNNEKYIAEACSHENGHSVGLHHQGTTGGTVYYAGHGDWAPIMGNSYQRPVTQWARGEYAGANSQEDQLQIMQQNGLAYYPDDHGNTAEDSTTLAGGTALSGYGFIERTSDVDVFRLQTGAGAVSIAVNPAPVGPDLKILAELYDAGGSLIASSSLANLGAAIAATVPAGTYYLAISGVGSGDPATNGYSDYASLGQYTISGTAPPAATLAAPTRLRVIH